MSETSGRNEHLFVSRFFHHVGEEGTEIADRKCLVEHDKVCSMKCFHAMVVWNNNGFVVFCSMFNPIIYLGKRQF